MTDEMTVLLQKIDEAERNLDQAITDWRNEVKKSAKSRINRFSSKIRAEHGKLRRSLLAHLGSIRPQVWLTAPFIYGLIVPLVLTDLAASLYQFVCFPIYGMRRARRADFVVIDRHRLGYLNALEKLNCVYCGYANGVIAYVREIASRTEQYFCPIKHSVPMAGCHVRYRRFVDYGDAQGYRDRFAELRARASEP